MLALDIMAIQGANLDAIVRPDQEKLQLELEGDERFNAVIQALGSNESNHGRIICVDHSGACLPRIILLPTSGQYRQACRCGF